MFICDGATRHKERATMPRDFPRLLRRVQPIFPNPCQDVWLCCILFSLLLYEEWSNQARKHVSSVCRRVKRDFQNNPLSRWGFFFIFMYYFLLYCECLSRGNDNYCPDAVFLNGRTFFFFLFRGATHNYCVACPHMWWSRVIIRSLDGSYFVKWNAELLHTRSRSWSDTCK